MAVVDDPIAVDLVEIDPVWMALPDDTVIPSAEVVELEAGLVLD